MKKLIILCFFLCSCSSQYAGYGTWANDIVGDTDQQFTNGFEFGVQIPADNLNSNTTSAITTLPSLRLFDSDPKEFTGARIAISNEMYTPSDLRTSEIIEDENPYGGVSALSFTRTNASPKALLETQLKLGVSGEWSGSGQLQKFVHTDLGFGTDPKGWDNQIGSEPVVNLNFTRELFSDKENFWKAEYAHSSGARLRLGNQHTDIRLYKNFKFGHNLRLPTETSNDYSVYFFSEPYAKGVLHNIYYDGALFADNPHTVDSSPFIIGISNGVAIEKGNYSIKFDYHVKSPEYDNSDHIHKFGILSFGVKW